MIYRFFSLTFKSSLTVQERAKVIGGVRLLAEIPEVESCMVGEIDEGGKAPDCGGVIVLRDAEAYARYIQNPIHIACLRQIVAQTVPGAGPGYDVFDDPAEREKLHVVRARIPDLIAQVDPEAAIVFLQYVADGRGLESPRPR